MAESDQDIDALILALRAAEADAANAATRADRISAGQALSAMRFHAAPRLIAAIEALRAART